jgi:hypothetical protein
MYRCRGFESIVLRPYSKSSLTLNEWKFSLSFSRVSLLFLNIAGGLVSYRYYVTILTFPAAIEKQRWLNLHSCIEYECEPWAFRIRVLVQVSVIMSVDY